MVVLRDHSTQSMYTQDWQRYRFYSETEHAPIRAQRPLASASLTDRRRGEVTKPRTKTRLCSLWWTALLCYEWNTPRFDGWFSDQMLFKAEVRWFMWNRSLTGKHGTARSDNGLGYFNRWKTSCRDVLDWLVNLLTTGWILFAMLCHWKINYCVIDSHDC